MASENDDSFIVPLQGNAKLPAQGRNNLWMLDRETDAALVFVHGIFSDSRDCWLDEKSGTYWPDLVSRDSRFANYSIFLGGYSTGLNSAELRVNDCADQLYRAMGRPEKPMGSSALERSTIVFVCHSTGGIVVRYMLESRAAEFRDKIVGLVLIASPSYGSYWASTFSWLAQIYNARLAAQLKWANDTLMDLDDRFHRLIQAGGIPRLIGVEAYENHFIVSARLFRNHMLVVSRESAGRYFQPPHLLPNTDHFTCVKPDSEHHPAHELLIDFVARVARLQADLPETTIDLQVDLVQPSRDVPSPSPRNIALRQDHSKFRIGSEIRICARPNIGCYLTIVDIGSSGLVTILYPNSLQGLQRLAANVWYIVPAPDKKYSLPLQGPLGTERLICIATSAPLALTEDDLHTFGSEQSLEKLAKLLKLPAGQKLLGLAESIFEVV
jgi:Domain of unknown function (DUF4384)